MVERNSLLVLVLVVLLLGVVVYFSGGLSSTLSLASAAEMKDDSGATSESVHSVALGINRFSLNLLKEMGKGNVFISPVSIEFALTIAAEGARGKTLDEMLSALQLPRGADVRRPAFARIYNLLNRKSDVTIELANALWLRPGFSPKRDYISTVERYYPADIYSTIDPARINQWVSERTHGKIDKIINSLPSSTAMVITNAVYFYGKWAEEFDPKLTRKMPFHTPSGDKDVDMMYDERKVQYYEDSAVQAVLLPYIDKNFAMLILLPKGDVDKYLESLSAEGISRILKSMSAERVRLYIPKFEFKTGIITLNGYLQDLGMRFAFDPARADFSRISSGLYISSVLHRAYVRVDEKGTEAAAATAVIMSAAADVNPMPPKVFKVDHPFLFFIIDRESGVVLFAGKIVDPPAVES